MVLAELWSYGGEKFVIYFYNDGFGKPHYTKFRVRLRAANFCNGRNATGYREQLPPGFIDKHGKRV